MAANRLLKYINIALGAILLAGVAAVYWFGWRPLPQTSGTITAPISREGTILRDALYVPHIEAATEADLLFLHGYVAAQDRLWQMDALRRLAAGELAEVAGVPALQSDQASRRLRLRRIAEQQQYRLSPRDRASFAAYALGVNYFIETHQGKLPLEFQLMGYSPRPWSVVDSILVGLQMYHTLTKTWEMEVQKQAMLSAGEPAKVQALFPVRTGVEVQPGSNAWVVSGRHTASGKPMLANDMHLEWAVPATWHIVRLRAPGINVAGVSLPGLPGVIAGHNERIAWGITNLGFDVQDLYIEKLDTKTGRYPFQNDFEQARLESDLIPVKGSPPLPSRQWLTRHGPVSYTYQDQYMALRWVASDSHGFSYAFLDLDRAENWQQFREALSRMSGPGSNFVYADVDGNIGYQVAGWLPIRKNYDGSVPVSGESGTYEWEGYIPFDQLPSIYNPPDGIIVTANQNPFPEHYPYRVAGNFDPGYRSRLIRLALERKGRFEKPEDMIVIQKDVYSAFSHFLARELAQAVDRKRPADPRLAQAAGLLRSWNGQMEMGEPAAMIASLTFNHLRRALAERAAPGKSEGYTQRISYAVVERLLHQRPADWFKDWDQQLLAGMSEALAEGDRMQGANPSKWNYGKYNELRIVHPIGGRLPILHTYFNLGPVPMSGAADTIKQTSQRIGPSQRFVADLANWDRSLMNVLAGQSGHVLSRHYRDQFAAHYYGRSFPLRFHKLGGKELLIVRPEGPAGSSAR